jgi:molybdopterin synthase catalytic subunit
VSVLVQAEAFDPSLEYKNLLARCPGAAVATFSGYVRDFSASGAVTTLELEHYPGMAERVLEKLGTEATTRFGLRGFRIAHRFGLMPVNDIIVWVGTVADHRGEALAACEFIMDTLKTDAPFWKRETGDAGSQWVDARKTDAVRRDRWNQSA